MRAIYAFAVACLLAGLSHAAPSIGEWNIDTHGKPLDQGGLPQWILNTKVGNTGTFRLYTYSGDDVFNPSSYTVTFMLALTEIARG